MPRRRKRSEQSGNSETPKLIATKCGHPTVRAGDITAFGETAHLQNDGAIDYCFACIADMTIQCAWCAHPIFIGSPVTLYTPSDRHFVVPEHAVVYHQEPLQLVGCLGWDCALTGADRSGFWIPNDEGRGHVYQVVSPLEQAFSRKEPVIVSNLGDIAEATTRN
jgi:hypothetical protein